MTSIISTTVVVLMMRPVPSLAQSSQPPVGGFTYWSSATTMPVRTADPLTACQSAYNGQGQGFYNFRFPTTGTNSVSEYHFGVNPAGLDGVMCSYKNDNKYIGYGWFLYGCPDGYTEENMMCKTDPDRDVKPVCDDGSDASVGDPIDIGSASVKETVIDYQTSNFQPIGLKRIYNSRGRPGRLLGNSRWHFDFEYELVLNGNGADLYTPEGSHYVFSIDSNNNYTSLNNEGPVALSIDRYGQYNVTLADKTNLIFIKPSSTVLLSSLTRNDGLTETFSYVGQNSDQLAGISSSSGSITFTTDNDTSPNVTLASVNNYYRVNYSYSSATASNVTYAKLLTQASRTQNGTPVDSVQYVYENATYPYLMTGVIDERGVRTSKWTFDNTARATSSIEGGNLNQTTVAYDDVAKTRTATNSLNKKTTYNLRSAKGLMQVGGSSALNSASTPASSTAMSYDGNNNLASQTDEEGRVTAFVRDSYGRPTQITTGSGSSSATTRTISYLQGTELPSSISDPGLTTNFSYNSYGQITQVTQIDTTTQTTPFSTSGRSRTWNYTYGQGGSGFAGPLLNGLLMAIDGPLSGSGDTTSYTYNQSNYIKTVTDELGHVTTVTAWNALGEPTSVTGMNGAITAYSYDGRGRVTSITVSPGSSQTQWSFSYTAAGDLATVTQPSGAVYTMTWDDARRLTKVADNLGETINYTHDTMGNVTGRTITAADGQTVVYQIANTFDDIGRLIKQVGGENATWNYNYDRTNLNIGISDPRGKTLSYGYDALSRLIEETERDGGKVTHAYNGKSEETGYTDPRNLVTTYVRDGFGDVIQESSPDRGTTVYDYDARGLMISRKDARSKLTTYSYDNAGRLTAVNYPADTSLNITYSYDGNQAGANGIGHLTRIHDAAGSTDYIYDAVGRVTGEVRTIGGISSTVSYGWDPAGSGRLNTLTLPSGFMLTYYYDALGRPNQLSVSLDTRIPLTPVVGNIRYFPFGELQQVNYYNGVARYQSNDLQYRISGLFLSQGSKTLMERFFAFDDNLNMTQINDNATDASKSQSLNYDDVQRLTYAAGLYGTRFWQYDILGNRISETKTLQGSSTATSSSYNYTAGSNQINSIVQGSTTIRSLSYDAAGNTVQDNRNGSTYKYAINDAGRIAQLTIGSTVTADYKYDGRDRLSTRQTVNTTPAATTAYIYDVWNNLIAETGPSGHPIREYMWVGREPVAVIDWTVNSGTPTLFYVHTDHLHRPELMTDTSGNVVWTASYEPFGSVVSINGAIVQSQRFSGQWFQMESGLAYNWHRHYDATLGRYASPDPIGIKDGSNIFGYVRQNPLLKVDFDGRCPVCAIAVVDAAEFAYGAYTGYRMGSAAMAAVPHPNSNPLKGDPGEEKTCTNKKGNPKQTRRYGEDGYPDTDTDWDHSHGGLGAPHVHDWGRPEDGGSPTWVDRGDGRLPAPGDPGNPPIRDR